MIRLFIPLPLVFLVSCGAQSPNAAFETSYDKNRIDVLLQRAVVELDRNKLDSAQSYALDAYNRNPNNYNAAFILANVYVAKAHLTLLDLAGRISSDLDTSNSKASSNTQALDVVSVLQDVISLSSDDIKLLATDDGGTSSTYFKDLPVLKPLKPGSISDTSSPRYKVEGLRLLNQSINVLCPFVDSSITSGTNDSRYNCKKVTNSTVQPKSRVHFAFALSNLLEAIYFNSVIIYGNSVKSSSNSTAAIESSNIFKRIEAIKNVNFTTTAFDATTFSNYSSAVVTLAEDVTSIFDLSQESMLTAMMVDLRVAAKSLKAISGFPNSLRDKIDGVLTTIENTIAKANQDVNSISGQTTELKNQLTKTLFSNLSSSINSVINSIPSGSKTGTTQENIVKACKAVKDVPGFTLPTACNGNT